MALKVVDAIAETGKIGLGIGHDVRPTGFRVLGMSHP
jgi:hypothetical protein